MRGKGFTQYFIVADDMIINPKINELNFWEQTGISLDSCYISSFISFQTRTEFWERTTEALTYSPYIRGTEIRNIIPEYDKALEMFRYHNLPTDNIPFKLLKMSFS